MKRRDFIVLGGATLLVPNMAWAAKPLEYKKGLVAQLLSEGKTVFVDFYAPWCSTCRTQGRNIEYLRKQNPAYDANITFVKVNWDAYEGSPISRKYKIPRRSTLIIVRGDELVGKIVAQSSRNSIKALLDKGLAAT